jgi:hypothetical protein
VQRHYFEHSDGAVWRGIPMHPSAQYALEKLKIPHCYVLEKLCDQGKLSSDPSRSWFKVEG